MLGWALPWIRAGCGGGGHGTLTKRVIGRGPQAHSWPGTLEFVLVLPRVSSGRQLAGNSVLTSVKAHV